MKFIYIVSWCVINLSNIGHNKITKTDCGYEKRFKSREKFIRFVECAPTSVKIVKIDSLKID